MTRRHLKAKRVPLFKFILKKRRTWRTRVKKQQAQMFLFPKANGARSSQLGVLSLSPPKGAEGAGGAGGTGHDAVPDWVSLLAVVGPRMESLRRTNDVENVLCSRARQLPLPPAQRPIIDEVLESRSGRIRNRAPDFQSPCRASQANVDISMCKHSENTHFFQTIRLSTKEIILLLPDHKLSLTYLHLKNLNTPN